MAGAVTNNAPASATSPSPSSSTFRMMASQELCMLVPASVPWWPRHDWDAWLQRNASTAEATARELDAKLDVTPETNDTSSSETAVAMTMTDHYNDDHDDDDDNDDDDDDDDDDNDMMMTIPTMLSYPPTSTDTLVRSSRAYTRRLPRVTRVSSADSRRWWWRWCDDLGWTTTHGGVAWDDSMVDAPLFFPLRRPQTLGCLLGCGCDFGWLSSTTTTLSTTLRVHAQPLLQHTPDATLRLHSTITNRPGRRETGYRNHRWWCGPRPAIGSFSWHASITDTAGPNRAHDRPPSRTTKTATLYTNPATSWQIDIKYWPP